VTVFPNDQGGVETTITNNHNTSKLSSIRPSLLSTSSPSSINNLPRSNHFGNKSASSHQQQSIGSIRTQSTGANAKSFDSLNNKPFSSTPKLQAQIANNTDKYLADQTTQKLVFGVLRGIFQQHPKSIQIHGHTYNSIFNIIKSINLTTMSNAFQF
jgi:hypothetical protein